MLVMSNETPPSDTIQRDAGPPVASSPSSYTLPWTPLQQVSCIQPARRSCFAPNCPIATSLLRDEEVSVGTQALLEMLILLE